jgi:hypothetical protein
MKPARLLVAAAILTLLAPRAGAQSAEIVAKEVSVADVEATVDADEIGEHAGVLASDLFEGREAGSRGEERAAAYLVSVLESCPDLKPDGPDDAWLQPFEMNLRHEPVTAHNVLARLAGRDPALAGQFIVLGAHYDHVGLGRSGNTLDMGNHEIHNGADDNASGSSVLLELATTLARSDWRPRRTLLFQWYSGEELGLLGSKHWVAHPTHPLSDVVLMLNMDMVGRMVGRTMVVGGTGTAPGFGELVREVSQGLDLTVLDDPPGSAPSDNTSFYEKDVPALFLFTGLHDDYHRASDDPEKLDLPGARDVGRLALRLLAAIDARDERPAFQKSPGSAYNFTPHLYLGVAFEATDAQEPGAVRAAVVIPDAPAAQAGLKEGDYIRSCNGTPITALAELQDMLKTRAGPVEPVALDVRRLVHADPASFEDVHLVLQPTIR